MAREKVEDDGGGVEDDGGGAPLAPHPLVLGVAARMFGNLDVTEAQQAAGEAREERYATAERVLGERAPNAVRDFVTARDRGELVMMDGYLADRVRDPDDRDGSPWQIMYVDETLETYVLVRSSDIQLHHRVDDEQAAFGVRDQLWVLAEAPVLRGARTESVASRITNGAFTRAGDFRASVSGGTLTGASDLGPLCTGLTSCACKRLSP